MPEELFKELIQDFIYESQERINRIEDSLLALSKLPDADRSEVIHRAKRELHTLKGNAGMMGLDAIQSLTHALEDQVEFIDQEQPVIQNCLSGLDQLRELLGQMHQQDAPEASDEHIKTEVISAGLVQDSLRVSSKALDELVNLLAEMVIFRNRLKDSIDRGRLQSTAKESWDVVTNAENVLSKTLSFIQDRILQLRMISLKTLFRRLRRLVHDEQIKELKDIQFHVSGGDTPMDKALLEIANEVLGHLIRNAVIHGIETPQEREQLGKSRTGNIHLRAITQTNEILIDIEDDGAGIDTAELLQTAADRSIEVLPHEDPLSLLFKPGFSTKRGTDLSAGRGVGLSAVIESVRQVGGGIEIFSEKGTGSCFRLRLPLNISIVRAMILRADDEEYALPLSAIIENFRFQAEDIHEVNHNLVINWRDDVIPLLDLGCFFDTTRQSRKVGYVVIVEVDGKNRGLLSDDIAGIREIVVKKLDPIVGQPNGILGSTILGDGRVILILDPTTIVTSNLVTGV